MNIPFNDDWLFTFDYERGFDAAEKVRLPHTVKELPYNYVDCKDYQTVCGYQKSFFVPDDWSDKLLSLRFDGAAHSAVVYCNGEEVAHHDCGYTAFEVDLTSHISFGAENTVTVKLDCRESLNVPPFGFVIDYLCYGGLYREVSLLVRSVGFIGDVLIENTALREIKVRISTERKLRHSSLLSSVIDADGKTVATARGHEFKLSLPDARLWSPESPYLYTLKVCRLDAQQRLIDEKSLRFGFRTAEFKKDGFYINGSRLKLRGLNRHQSYAYVGYAMPKSMQVLDAKILKNELGVNAVRTSHYPQSQHFLDRCDELGLLVFTEIPGWQHIGDAAWKEQAVDNTEEMIRQNMHHPSIILWGVRINESQDCDELYRRTNKLAHRLDSSRQTSGVRYLEKSSLLEDVYAFNDFSHFGTNAGLKPMRKVTSDKSKPYLVSECNGHMFPTKPFDDEAHRLSHALRHAKVLDAMYASGDICGIFPWCMFDYNTHRDFGSGDAVCYHGVMDMFRNPKLAAAVYASQSDDTPCCTVSSTMDIGEHPAGYIGSVYVFTNADFVRLYKNGIHVADYYPAKDKYPALPHPPVVIDDFIGNMLETVEGYDSETSAALKECLLAVAADGMSNLSPKIMLKLAKLMLFKGLSFSDGYELYGKYVGNWGGEATVWRFDAIKNAEVVASVTRKPGVVPHIVSEASSYTLTEAATYDVSAVRIRAVDKNGNVCPYYNEPVTLEAKGAIELIGPSVISLKGGCGGTYVKSTGQVGEGVLTVNGSELKFKVTKDAE